MSDTPEKQEPNKESAKDSKEVSEATIYRLVTAVNSAYNRQGLMMWRSFLGGLMAALGATVGTAIIFTILLWTFQHLGGIDLFKSSIDKIQSLVIPAKFIDPQVTATPSK